MTEPENLNPLNVPVSLFLQLRPLRTDRFTVSKCFLCCSFPIGYIFLNGSSLPDPLGMFWPPRAVLWCQSVQNLLWGWRCRCGVQRHVCLWPLPTCPRHKTFALRIQGLKHLPGGWQWVPVSPGCPPWCSGDGHCHGAECH